MSSKVSASSFSSSSGPSSSIRRDRSEPATARAEGLVEGLRMLAKDLAMQTRLSEVGISHNNLPMLAEDAMKQTRLLVNNPREMTYEAALKIYEAAL